MAELAILGAAGSVVQAMGTLAGGAATDRAKRYEASQHELAGKNSFAASQRQAMAENSQMQRLESRARAVGAASGFGGAVDTSTLQQIGDIEQEGRFRMASRLFEGEDAKRSSRAKAAAARFEGKTARIGSYFEAGGEILKGIGSMAGPAGGTNASAQSTLAGGGGIGSDARFPLNTSSNWARKFG